MKKYNIKKLTISAILIALGTILAFIKVYEMPLGGSVTLLSMLPVCIISISYGISWGIKAAFVYSLGQLGLSIASVAGWGLSPAALAGTVIMDYILPFTLLGLAGIFKSRGKLGSVLGIILVMVLRFTCHFISGIVIFDIWCDWSSVPLYSLCYNGAFMLPEMIITVIGAYFVLSSKTVAKLINVE